MWMALKQLRGLLSRREKLVGLMLAGMMVVAAGLEVAGVGMLMPVVAALTKPELLDQNSWLRAVRQYIGGGSTQGFLVYAAAAVAMLYVAKNLFQLLLIRRQCAFVYSKAERIAVRLLDNYLAAPYSFHLQRHSADCLNAVVRVPTVLGGVLLPFLGLVSEGMVLAAIFGVLLYFAPVMSLALAGVMALMFLPGYRTLRRHNLRLGEAMHATNAELMKTMQQALAGIKEIKVLHREEAFSRRHALQQRRDKAAYARAQFLGQIPRLFIEAFMVVLVMGLLAASLAAGVADGTILLRFTLLAVAMIRMMPSLSRIQYSLSQIRQHQISLERVREDLALPAEPPPPPDAPELAFERAIATECLGFRYPGAARPVFDGVSVTIPRNASVALVGPTGCGKTTFVDLLLGLLEPTRGRILVDGRDIRENLPSWQRRIGYVPQHIFMLDDTIRANVAFGIPPEAVDDARVEESLRAAQVWDFIATLPEGTRTMTGECGARLSGGQRQRIGIARALYHKPTVLVLDEATSALDLETEQAFVDALAVLRGRMTLLMIAHRPATVAQCDHVLRIGPGGVAALERCADRPAPGAIIPFPV